MLTGIIVIDKWTMKTLMWAINLRSCSRAWWEIKQQGQTEAVVPSGCWLMNGPCAIMQSQLPEELNMDPHGPHAQGWLKRRGHASRCVTCVGHSVVSISLWPHGLQPTRLLCPWDSPGKNTGVGSHSLLQGIFQTQGSNPGLLHCRHILHRRSHQGSLRCVMKLFK